MRPPLAVPEPNSIAHQRAENDAHYYRNVLHELIDIGASLARLIHQQALTDAEAPNLTPDQPPHPTPDPTIAFDRVARSIRRTIILARRLAEPTAWAVPNVSPATHTHHRTAARTRIIRDVEDAIQRTTGDHECASLHAELLDRLDSPDLDDDIDHRPTAEIIADICRDLGIAAPPGTQPWKRRTPADIAALHARAAAPPIPTSSHPPPSPVDACAILQDNLIRRPEP